MAQPPIPFTTPEELAKFMATNPPIRKLDVPSFFVTGLAATVTPTDVALVFNKPHPIMVGAPGQELGASAIEPVVVVNMSLHTAKDLALLLQINLAAYEAQWGKLETDYTRQHSKKT